MTTIMWGIPVITCLKWYNHTLHVYKFSSFNYPGNKTVAYYVWNKICSAQILLEEQALDKEFGYDNRGVVFHSFHSHRIIWQISAL